MLLERVAALLDRWKAEYRLVPDEQDLIEAVLRDLVSGSCQDCNRDSLVPLLKHHLGWKLLRSC